MSGVVGVLIAVTLVGLLIQLGAVYYTTDLTELIPTRSS
jgi:hypothetical protein